MTPVSDVASTISVIIPTCDRPSEFLNSAIASALAQSLSPLEILIIDNGISKVHEEDLASGVELYRLKPHVGVSRARNFGAAMARGDYVAFLDDDDWWDEGFLKEAWRVAVEGDYRCVYGRKDRWRDGRLSRYKMAAQETVNVPCLLRGNPGIGGQNLLIEKALFFSIGGFDERLFIAEDRALALEILLSGERIGVARDAVAILRHHDGDRLRNFKFRKINFIWKYRHHMTKAWFARSVLSFAKSGIRHVIRRILVKYQLPRSHVS
ncbi:glycosyltransferase family 2 protein [Halomonas kalidii]|uniref:Glycosyltransferase family 2 protein n=1 Tax=Halomonas kalidii TaxID=3043293 RepID=A0ABT6VK79_9GAMM|nr:glycosyltransferase family 2 protein [Halomonas kalidii]MDI5934380.1 glycosyltransferase family 2 protein [Halomonas kalidii]